MFCIKSIKNIALILTLALTLTVGAVYAVFTYSQGDVAPQSNNLASNIETATVDGAKGVISFGETNTLTLNVVNSGSNTTGKGTIDGSVTATFTPNANADEDVTTNGIAWAIKVEFTGTNTYNGQTILTTSASSPVVINNGTKSKTVTIDSAVLNSLIDVTSISLSTKAEYDAYKAAYEGVTIRITLSEYVTAE